MADASRHDAWQAGDSYDAYMGRWSRMVAPPFLDWLAAPAGLDWLEVGCGTGALSATIVARSDPARLTCIDSSQRFIDKATGSVRDPRVEFRIGDAQALVMANASRDVVISGLMLNFVPDRGKALDEMRRVARPGGLVGFYVWDYPGGGLEFLRAFWRAAVCLDPTAESLSECRRFPDCTAEGLRGMATAAGLRAVDSAPIEIATVFADFDDYWRPFTLGAGPAPGYCASLEPQARDRLRDRLHDALRRREDGSIAMTARAWAVKARVD